MSNGRRLGIVAACTAVMLVEGFDLLIYSNAIPALLADPALGIDRAAAGRIGSMVFAGMLLGGVGAGRAVAAFGLGRVLVAGFVLFTVATAAVATVASGTQLGLLRLLTGIGLGAVLPSAVSLARAQVTARRGALAISVVMSGVPLGGMLAAVLAMPLLPAFGWRALFLVGGVLGVVLLVAAGPALAAAGGALPTARGNDGTVVATSALRSRSSAVVLAIGAAATFADLLTWYGIGTWLTQLMRELQIPFGGALQLMFTLNIGAVVGGLLAALLAMGWGNRPVAIGAGLVASACLAVLATRVLSGAWLFGVVALLGMAAISAQNLVNALVADAFPAAYRAAAVGTTLGIGRLGAVVAPALGGTILASGQGPGQVLCVFALSALLGALLLGLLSPARVRACREGVERGIDAPPST